MAVKCIAIGNRMMRDDGIGIKVVETLSKRLTQLNIEVILAETDVDYAVSLIEDGDFLLIVDSTYYDLHPGTVTVTSIEEAAKEPVYIDSQHRLSLLNQLRLYQKSAAGWIIGIEVKEIDFSLELSESLEKNFSETCEEVYYCIYQIMRRINHA